MTDAAARIIVGEDEYMARELASEVKHELIHGTIVAMAGASREHNAISINIARALGNRVASRRCLVFGSDQRVHVEATGLYTYPDVTVACDGLRFHPKYRDTLLSPRVIVEVLSDATEAYDRGAKFGHYRTLSSLQEYVLISQDEERIEHYRRLEAGEWLLTIREGKGASVDLPALGCTLPLAEVYENLDLLAPPPSEPAA